MHLASGARRSPKYSFKSGLESNECASAFFTLHPSAGVLSGMICFYVDDLLGTGDDLFGLKLRNSINWMDSVR